MKKILFVLMFVSIANAREIIQLDVPPSTHVTDYSDYCELVRYEMYRNSILVEYWDNDGEDGNVEETVVKNKMISEKWIYYCEGE